jgi:hypothetical protein
VICTIVPTSEVSRTWPKVRRYIRAACAWTGGVEKADDLKVRCMNEEGHVLAVLHEGRELVGAAVLEANGQALHVTSLGGNLPKGWLPSFVDWLVWVALHCGTREITLRGRKGWQRRLAGLGFVPDASGELRRKI